MDAEHAACDFINTFVSQPFFALPMKCFYDDNFIGAEIAPFLTFRSKELCLPFGYYPLLFCLLIIMLSHYFPLPT